MIDLRSKVREVPDFPEPGIGFKDITPLLLDPLALKQAVDELASWTAERKPDLVLGAEARGFLLGAAIACEVGCGFVPARRPGKLPPETVSARYVLEYGENALEVNADAIAKGARVVIHDDVLATGGTVEAIAGLVENLGGRVVGVNFVIELSFLNGREKLGGYDVLSPHRVLGLLQAHPPPQVVVLVVGHAAEGDLRHEPLEADRAEEAAEDGPHRVGPRGPERGDDDDRAHRHERDMDDPLPPVQLVVGDLDDAVADDVPDEHEQEERQRDGRSREIGDGADRDGEQESELARVPLARQVKAMVGSGGGGKCGHGRPPRAQRPPEPAGCHPPSP